MSLSDQSLHLAFGISNPEIPHDAGGSESDDAELSDCTLMALNYLWQEIMIWLNWGNFRVRDSILAITLATSIRFAHMTPIRKSLFGAHVMATELCSVCIVSSPKSAVFLSKTIILDIFFLLW
jgi:hypothetical protein